VFDQPLKRFFHRLERGVPGMVAEKTLRFRDTAIWAVCDVVESRLGFLGSNGCLPLLPGNIFKVRFFVEPACHRFRVSAQAQCLG
jgi:hypothetical protein